MFAAILTPFFFGLFYLFGICAYLDSGTLSKPGPIIVGLAGAAGAALFGKRFFSRLKLGQQAQPARLYQARRMVFAALACLVALTTGGLAIFFANQTCRWADVPYALQSLANAEQELQALTEKRLEMENHPELNSQLIPVSDRDLQQAREQVSSKQERLVRDQGAPIRAAIGIPLSVLSILFAFALSYKVIRGDQQPRDVTAPAGGPRQTVLGSSGQFG